MRIFQGCSTVRVNVYNYLLLALTSVTVVLGIRVVGSLLISSLIIFPAVTALQISKGFRSSLILSSFISVSCVIIGITLAFFLN
ncbi:MAG: metal ABC transporter permease [Clostridia bacterium]